MRLSAFALIACLIVTPAYAKYSGGTGEPNDPYQIATAADLILLGETPEDYGKHFILTADIDLDPNLPGRKVFDKAVIAPDMNDTQDGFQGTPFTGVFDGNGHTISRLTIQGGKYLGLFGQLPPGAEVRNLGVADVNITGFGLIGGLVGENWGTVSRCYCTGAVCGRFSVGGLAGLNWLGTVAECYATGSVSGEEWVGGLVGGNSGTYGRNGGTVLGSYNAGAVTGKGRVGGLVGQNFRLVSHSYNTGAVSGTGPIGGLVGYNLGAVTQSYSSGRVSGARDVGGLIGDSTNTGSVYPFGGGGIARQCFWDTQTSGQATSAGGIGKSTAEMQTAGTFIPWLGCVWTIDEGRDYPHLGWENMPGVPITRTYYYGGGSGSRGDPYLIYTAEQLTTVGLLPFDWDKHFKLMADIDLSGYDDEELRHPFYFVGTVEIPFSGVFDGNGHWLHNYRSSEALFRYVAGTDTEIKNLGLIKPNVAGDHAGSVLVGLLSDGTVSNCDIQDCNLSNRAFGGTSTGGLVYINSGTIRNCHISGQVSGNRHGVGGLVACNGEDGTITCCSFSGSLMHTGVGEAGPGGLVGYNYGGISFCYTTGLVSGEEAGGVVGDNFGVISNCYSMSNVLGWDWQGGPWIRGPAAGLVGKNEGIVSNCYSTGTVSGGDSVGGLVWSGWPANVTASFWDTQTSGQVTSAGGVGKTTSRMQTASTFLDAGWDFVGETANGTDDIWRILEGKDYPRFLWEQGQARPYCPSQGAVDVLQPVVFRWRPGGQGLLHDVYFGEDEATVAGATPTSPGIYLGRQPAETVAYEPGDLGWGRTYYWRIDEVNQTDPGSVWKGEVWSFTVTNFIVAVIDDFESYTDDYRAAKIIWQTWISGGDNGTGSWVGNYEPPYAEQVIVHGGNQSMPMEYDNTVEPWYSEAERTWETPQDWTINDADTLTLYFRGQAGNSREPLYVTIADSADQTAMVTNPDPNAVLATKWQRWYILLADLRAVGVEPSAVKTMAIGVGDRSNPKPGGTGKIYIDDIRLTKRMP